MLHDRICACERAADPRGCLDAAKPDFDAWVRSVEHDYVTADALPPGLMKIVEDTQICVGRVKAGVSDSRDH